MTAKPFSAEVLLLGWGTSPASGHWIKVQLDPALDGEAHPFRLFKSGAANGQRFRMDFAAIGDDEMVAAGTAGSSADLSRAPAAGASTREGEGGGLTVPPIAPPAAGPSPAERYASKGEGQKAVVRAALLCEDVKFQRWLRYQYPVVWTEGLARGDTAPDMTAAYVLRRACFIESRGELATNDNALDRFADIETAFKTARDYSPNLTGRK